jgi:MFS family permease
MAGGTLDEPSRARPPVQLAPTSRLNVRDQFTLSVLWFSLNFQSAALLPVVVPAQILLFVAPGSAGNVQQATFLGWLSAVGSLVALIVQPVVGALSDRTVSRLGRRRPYILIGGALLLAGVAGLAAARGVAAFVGGFLVAQLGSNVTTAAYQGLLPDRVPAEQRGTA